MDLYQCPFCSTFHDRDQQPKCPNHTLGYSPRCGRCREVEHQIPCRQAAGTST